jgi:penicillin amidase
VTANNRLVGGLGLQMLGPGSYDPGARARQIRDDLRALRRPRERDMLDVQLDDRALLMERWRSLALGALTEPSLTRPERREFRRLIQTDWNGRASTDSVGYRLVREFRTKVAELALAPFVAEARQLDPDFPATPGRSLEGPVWALVTGRPRHLLDPKYPDWHALLLDAVDRTVSSLAADGRPLADRSWGEVNTVRVQHPLAGAVPWVGAWLNMPPQALPGDLHVPRVQGPTMGASERLTVSPGHEEDGYFHMPAGQSGHPLSPNYRDGHTAWARGEPTPFLPGPAVTRLVLRP